MIWYRALDANGDTHHTIDLRDNDGCALPHVELRGVEHRATEHLMDDRSHHGVHWQV